MSLLNDALRKKKKEDQSDNPNSLVRTVPGSSVIGFSKKHMVAIILFLLLVVASFGIWQFYLKSMFSPKESMFTQDFSAMQDQGKQHMDKELQPDQSNTTQKTLASKLQKKDGVAEPQSSDPKGINREKSNNSGNELLRKKDAIPMPVVEKPKKRSLKKNKYLKKKYKNRKKVDERFYQKALSYHKTNNIKKAISMYEEILSNAPNHDDTLFNLAAAYIQISVFDKAYPILKKLLDRNPDNPNILLNLAIAEIGMNRPHEADSHLNMAESQKNQPDFEVFFHRGVAQSKINKLDEAVDWYAKAKKIEPNNPSLLFNLGITHEKLKEYSAAVSYYELSLEYGYTFSPDLRDDISARITEIERFLTR